MIAQAKVKFVHVSPTKVRQVIDLIRGRDVVSALTILENIHKGPTPMVKKTLNSAISNAKKKGLTEDQLVVSRVVAEKGPMWKRFKGAAFGRANPILRRTTHVIVELDLKQK